MEQAIETLKTALNRGANFWNAAEFYGPPDHNSLHVLEAYFAQHPDDASKVVLSVKGAFSMAGPDNSPEALRKSVENCLRVLKGRKAIDIFEPARVDQRVPIESVMGTLKQLRDEGLIKGIGLSECGAATIEKAAAVVDLACVETEISMWSTDALGNGILDTCARLRIPVVAYSPLGRGFLTGAIKSPADIPEGDFRRHMPRFQPDVFPKNLELVSKMEGIAKEASCTPAQAAIAWVRALGRDGLDVIPIPGAVSPSRVTENTQDVRLSPQQLAQVQTILSQVDIQGGRYGGFLAGLCDL